MKLQVRSKKYFFVIFPFAGAKCTASFMERCITYIGENAAECVKTNSFLNLTKDGLIKLISSDYVSKLLESHDRL